MKHTVIGLSDPVSLIENAVLSPRPKCTHKANIQMAPKPVEPLKLFLSYARRDIAAADDMVALLEGAGFEVTIDRRDLPYGEEWQVELADFIQASDTVVWLVSPASVASKWCRWELGELQRLNKRLIPVAIDIVDADDFPEALGRIHIMPSEGVFDESTHLSKLVKAIKTDHVWVKEHSRLGGIARQWVASDKHSDHLLRGTALSRVEGWRDGQTASAPQPSDDVLDLILASRRSQGRQQRITRVASFATTIIAVGLSVVALISRQQAVEQEAIALQERDRAGEQTLIAEANEARAIEQESLAEQRAEEAEVARQQAEDALNRATQTANSVAFNLAQNFRHSGLPPRLIADALAQARFLQESLAEHAADEPELLRGRASALYEMAEAMQALGDRESSLQLIEEALAISSSLLEVDGSNWDWRRDVAVQTLSLGDFRFDEGDWVGALTAYNEALASFRELSLEAPHDLVTQRDIAATLEKLGNWYLQAGQPEQALDAYHEGMDIFEGLVELNAGDHGLLHDMASYLLKIGHVHRSQNAHQAALTYYGIAEQSIRTAVDAEPDNLEWRYGLFVIGMDLGRAKSEVGDEQGALLALNASLDDVRALLLMDPDNTEILRGLALSTTYIGDLIKEQGDHAGAASLYDESLEVTRSLALRDPGNAMWQSDLVIALHRSSTVSQPVERVALLREALILAEELAEQGSLTAAQQDLPDLIRKSLQLVSDLLDVTQKPPS